MINLASFAKDLKPGVNAWFGESYNDWEELHTKIFQVESSNDAFEEDVGVSGYGSAQVIPEGGSVKYDTARQGFVTRYVHTTYGLGFMITKQAVTDGKYMPKAKKGATALARSIRHAKEVTGHNIFNRAFNSSYTGGDGVELCSLLHPNVAGGTYQNELSTAADLSEAALEQMCIDIRKWTDDRGLRINAMPEKLLLPVDLEFEIERILMSPYRVGTANNDINAIKSMGKFKEVIVSPYLTDTDAFFILTDVMDGVKYFESWADEFGQDGEFDTSVIKYKVEGRWSHGWTDPKGVYGTAGAA